MGNCAIDNWFTALKPYLEKDYIESLHKFIDQAYQNNICTPAKEDVFRALSLTPIENVRVVILGQDPYPNPNFACGLAFSVKPNVTKLPMSLRNIFKVACPDESLENLSGDLSSWANQGVLLLNTALTFADQQNHYKIWEPFTNAIISAVNDRAIKTGEKIYFLLWGNHAKLRSNLISDPNVILESAHPSPMSAKRWFAECDHFERVNEELTKDYCHTIDWYSVRKNMQPTIRQLF